MSYLDTEMSSSSSAMPQKSTKRNRPFFDGFAHRFELSVRSCCRSAKAAAFSEHVTSKSALNFSSAAFAALVS